MFNWLSIFLPRRSTPAPTRLPVQPDYRSPAAIPYLRVYEQSPWVYVAVNRIAEAAAMVPLSVYQMDGEHRLEVVRHPLEKLLDAPNPFTSRFELIEQTIGFLELTGNAYWFLSGGTNSIGTNNGAPEEIWSMRPDRVTIVPDGQNGIRGYLYEVDGQRLPLEAVEVVHFKRWNPGSDFYGLSALEAAKIAVMGDKAMAEWNRNTFGQDNGIPAGVVNVKEYVSDADFERLKREWRTSYGGTQRRTAFLRGGSIEWQNIGLSHTDLDFLNGRKAHRDEILNIFGIPVGLVSENATEANAKVAERMFIERTLYPKLVRLAQKITQELLPFWSGETTAEFEDIRPTDTQARLQEIRTAYPVLSINEIRERFFHLPAVEWGDHPVNYRPKSETDSAPATQESPTAPPLPAETPVENRSENTDSTKSASTKSAAAELLRWEKFALKRLGRTAARPFEPRCLPDDLAFEITAGLLASQDEDALRAVFAAAKAQLS